jgi:hypothetical protein
MKNKLVLAGMFSILLAFGIVVGGCDNGTTDKDGGPKTLVITDINAAQAAQGQLGIKIGIFRVGTTPEEASSWTGIIAGADEVTLSGSSEPFTITVPLYSAPFESGRRWTASGSYDVYLVLADSSYYRKQNVSFSSASTTVSATTFSPVTF